MRIISAILLIVISHCLYAQLTNNGGIVYIGNKASLYINGDIANNGKVENNGKLLVTGNWSNNNSYISTGSFWLIGQNQIIDHRNNRFSKLYIQSSDISSNNFITSATITDSLVLLNGLIIPNDSTHFILSENAQCSPGTDNSYIAGNIYFYGNGNKYLPIGTINQFAPIELFNVSGNNSLMGFKANKPLPQNITFGRGADTIFDTMYWEKLIKNNSATIEKIALSYNSPVIPDDKYITVLSSDSIQGRYRGLYVDITTQSRIPKEYVVSERTATGNYFTTGYNFLTPWHLFYIPNALSQHAPDQNDQVIKVYGDVFIDQYFHFTITNQWGNTVFETHSLAEMQTKGWDGINIKTGKREMTGQYHYIITAIRKDGIDYKDAGSLWIID